MRRRLHVSRQHKNNNACWRRYLRRSLSKCSLFVCLAGWLCLWADAKFPSVCISTHEAAWKTACYTKSQFTHQFCRNDLFLFVFGFVCIQTHSRLFRLCEKVSIVKYGIYVISVLQCNLPSNTFQVRWYFHSDFSSASLCIAFKPYLSLF